MDLQLRGRRVNLLCQSKFGAHYLLFYIVKYRKMTDVDENLKMFCSNILPGNKGAKAGQFE